MIPQYPPSVEPAVFVVSLSWAVISAMVLVHTVRMDHGRLSWLWAVSFVASSVIAAVFFWRLV
jgi:hypothetical protein